MTRVIVTETELDPLVEPVVTEPIPVDEPVEIPEVSDPDLLSQLNNVRETTATALDQIGDDIGDLHEVVAALVSAMDSVVDYLRDIYEAENAEGHTDIPAPVEAERKTSTARKELKDIEPHSRHRYRTAILGRTGGIYR